MRDAVSTSTLSHDLHAHRGRLFRQPLRAYAGATLLVSAFAAFGIFAAGLLAMMTTGEPLHAYWSLAGLLTFGFCRILAFLNNRHLKCTLCHGPVLHEKRCRKHAEAARLPGLSHRAATAILLFLTTTFTCMYCGTHFRLRK